MSSLYRSSQKNTVSPRGADFRAVGRRTPPPRARVRAHAAPSSISSRWYAAALEGYASFGLVEAEGYAAQGAIPCRIRPAYGALARAKSAVTPKSPLCWAGTMHKEKSSLECQVEAVKSMSIAKNE